MTVAGVRNPDEVIDCLARVGDAEPVRAFLQLPSQTGPGLLRMVELGGVELGGFGVSVDSPEEVKLSLLEGTDSRPACLPNCYVKAVRFSIPEAAPFPAELAVNSAVVGSEDADQT